MMCQSGINSFLWEGCFVELDLRNASEFRRRENIFNF